MALDLKFQGPVRKGEFDLWEAVDESSSDPAEHAYSCIAICRKNWIDGWPALGGTRCIESVADAAKGKEEVRHQAIELAMSMYIKNSILRKAAHSLNGHASGLFDWQGGKGVIWSPKGVNRPTDYRLQCHARLIDHLQGIYIGSKDAGVGTPQLEVIDAVTKHTIGLRCKKDTGEATATGVFSGIRRAVAELAEDFGSGPDEPLRGLPILVIGAGKVGLPLIGLLHHAGAVVHVFDDHLDPEALEAWFQDQVGRGAAITEDHLQVLRELRTAGRIFQHDQEEIALSQPEIRIVSPNGGPTEWLSRGINGSGRTRAEILAENRRRNGNLRLILGAGNDQVSTTRKGQEDRERTLAALAEAGLVFVPDPLVSPGGVIAVSHEREPEWIAERVNEDAERIVHRSVEQVFREARRRGGVDAVTMYKAFETMIDEDWD